jgi:hypothetical protein
VDRKEFFHLLIRRLCWFVSCFLLRIPLGTFRFEAAWAARYVSVFVGVEYGDFELLLIGSLPSLLHAPTYPAKFFWSMSFSSVL